MKNLKDGKEIYDNIKIPEEMEQNINDLIENNKNRADTFSQSKVIEVPISKRRRPAAYLRYTAAAAAVVLISFTTVLNSSEVFAMSAAKLPVVGAIARVLTVRSYESSEDNKNITVKVPEVVMDGDQNDAIESSTSGAVNSAGSNDTQAGVTGTPPIVADVNARIDKIVEDYLADAKARMQADKEAFLSTGGTEEEWNKRDLEINVDYEVKYDQGNRLSLMLSADESWYGAYDVKYFFNLDLAENRELTLKDVLGEDYVKIADDSIIRQMKERADANPDYVYWGVTDNDSSMEGFTTVDENTKFYLNSEGKPVVYFDKYEVAPGFMGAQEFVIE
ncbi:MAG TPA: DUF3298 domain-containing protein [Clostridiales bacterium]|nr:DUF3298 domain-containing protein [Clostridiales bacterium]